MIEITREEFGHGSHAQPARGREARGTHVALLTQDAEPTDQDWLASLLGGFEQAADVGLVYGGYAARPGASPAVRRELERWFGSLTPGIERLEEGERELPAQTLMGRRGFFTDANAAVARAAWERVPFREIAYAEDRALALDMLRAGYAKVYEPRAVVLHSHEYLRPASSSSARSMSGAACARSMVGVSRRRPRRLIGQLRGELGPLRRGGAGPRHAFSRRRPRTS